MNTYQVDPRVESCTRLSTCLNFLKSKVCFHKVSFLGFRYVNLHPYNEWLELGAVNIFDHAGGPVQIEAVLDPASPATKNASNAFFLKGKTRGVFGSLRDEGTLYKVGAV